MPMVSLTDEVAALRVIASLQELVDADTVWTRYLASATKIGSQDKKAILELNKRMDKLLVGVPSSMLVVQRIGKKVSKKTTADYKEILKTWPVEEQRQAEQLMGAEGGFESALRTYTTRVRKSVASERKRWRRSGDGSRPGSLRRAICRRNLSAMCVRE